MMNASRDDLASRVDQLELDNRRLKSESRLLKLLSISFFFGAMTVVIGGGAHPATENKTIDVERMIVRGKDGKIRASIDVSPTGTVRQFMFDGDGKPRLELSANNASSRLAGFASDGSNQVSLSTNQEGTTRLDFFDRLKNNRLALSIRPDGSCGLELADGKNKGRFWLLARSDGLVNQTFSDAEGRPRASYTTLANGESDIKFMGVNSKVKMRVGINNNLPTVSMFDDDQLGRASMSLMSDGTARIGLNSGKNKSALTINNTPQGDSSIEVTDDNQTGRLSIGFSADGSSGIGAYDKNGKERFSLHSLADGMSGLRISDPQNRGSANLLLKADSSIGLAVLDKNGIERVGLGVTPNGQVGFSLKDSQGDPRLSLGVRPQGDAGITLTSDNGTPIININNFKDLPKIEFKDKNNNAIDQIPR